MSKFKKLLVWLFLVSFLVVPTIAVSNDSRERNSDKPILLRTEQRLVPAPQLNQNRMEADIAVGQIVKVDVTALSKVKKGDLVTLEVGDEEVTAETTAVEVSEHPFPKITWAGRTAASADHEFSIIVLTLVEGKLSGTIDTGIRKWQIKPSENIGEGIIEEMTNAVMMNEYDIDDTIPIPEDIVPKVVPQNDTRMEMDLPVGVEMQADSASQQPYVIDLLAIYTTTLKNSLGGEANTKAEIQNKVDVMNTILRNSGINASVRIAGFKEVTLPDDTKMLQAISDMANSRNQFANIIQWMDEVNADIASLFVKYRSTSPYCGLAYTPGVKEFYTDSMLDQVRKQILKSVVAVGTDKVGGVSIGCDAVTLAHEVGHNLGGNHDIQTYTREGHSVSQALFPYAFGYCASNRTYGTIMSYCHPRVYYYSADRIVDNKRIGDPSAKNTDVFKFTIPYVSAVRNASVPTITVSGTVVDAYGKAVYGAKISAVDQNGTVVRTSQTDTSGKWTLSITAGTYTIIPSSPTSLSGIFNPPSLTVSSNQNNIKFIFMPKLVFSGKVLDVQNKPVKDIEVQIFANGQTTPLESVRTNANGEWKFEVTGSTSYAISAVPPDPYLYSVSPTRLIFNKSMSGITFRVYPKTFGVIFTKYPSSSVPATADYVVFQWKFLPSGAPYGWTFTIKNSTGQNMYNATGVVTPPRMEIITQNVPVKGHLTPGAYTAQVCINKVNVCSNVIRFTVK